MTAPQNSDRGLVLNDVPEPGAIPPPHGLLPADRSVSIPGPLATAAPPTKPAPAHLAGLQPIPENPAAEAAGLRTPGTERNAPDNGGIPTVTRPQGAAVKPTRVSGR